MEIQVPPERGPRAGTTREKVGICQRKRASLESDRQGTETTSPGSFNQVTGPQRRGTCETAAGHSTKAWQCQQHSGEAEQWQPWRNSVIMTQCLTREHLPAPQENDGKFSNSARKPPKTTQHPLPLEVTELSPAWDLPRR